MLMSLVRFRSLLPYNLSQKSFNILDFNSINLTYLIKSI